MITKKAFRQLEKVLRLGLDNSEWGVIEDQPKSYFGVKNDFMLEGKWLYVWLTDGEDAQEFDQPDQIIYDGLEEGIIFLYEM